MEQEHKGPGRPSKFKPEFVEQARKLCTLGAIDQEIADFFEIGTSTLYRWRLEYPEFRESLKAGKDALDERVVRSLYHRAVGFSVEQVKIFQGSAETGPVYAKYMEYYPPDVKACMSWLSNRCGWRMNPTGIEPDGEVPDGVDVEIVDASQSESD